MSAQKLKSGKWRARVYSHTDNEANLIKIVALYPHC